MTVLSVHSWGRVISSSERQDRAGQLLATNLGSYYRSPQFWSRPGQLILAIADNQQLLGAGFVTRAQGTEISQFRSYQLPDDNLALLKGLVVIPQARGQGIGLVLTAARCRWAADSQHSGIIAESWVESPAPGAGILGRAGFQEFAVVPGYWRSSTQCPRCQPQNCQCTAQLFYLPLSSY